MRYVVLFILSVTAGCSMNLPDLMGERPKKWSGADVDSAECMLRDLKTVNYMVKSPGCEPPGDTTSLFEGFIWDESKSVFLVRMKKTTSAISEINLRFRDYAGMSEMSYWIIDDCHEIPPAPEFAAEVVFECRVPALEEAPQRERYVLSSLTATNKCGSQTTYEQQFRNPKCNKNYRYYGRVTTLVNGREVPEIRWKKK